MKHSKHAKLNKPNGGLFHEVEMSLFGAPCDVINGLAKELIKELEPLQIAFADAEHKVVEKPVIVSSFTDKSIYNEVSFGGKFYIKRKPFLNNDAVITNGNHFNAVNQILILNSKKKESLSKKLDRLTNVVLVIKDDVTTPYDFLEGYIPEETPVLSIQDVKGISQFVRDYIRDKISQVKGLILMGGKSSRMGSDKAQLDYHGQAEYQRLYEMFTKLDIETSVSVADSRDGINLPQVVDSFLGLGPYGGILSAFKADPKCAILSVPCDVPLVDEGLVRILLDRRDPSKVATCFYNPETDFPEPLITLWEPKAYPLLLEFLSLGYSCPRKVLINSDIEMIDLGEASYKLKNANTPEERKMINQILSE
jgi:molybdopterin-guanine dinucleotide biosynthesis protein A